MGDGAVVLARQEIVSLASEVGYSRLNPASMDEESEAIALKTQDASDADKLTVPSSQPKASSADSGTSMDDVLRALQSITKQSQAIEEKLGQQGLNIELQVQKMSQRVEGFSTRVNTKVTQFQEEKHAVRICTVEEICQKNGFSRLLVKFVGG